MSGFYSSRLTRKVLTVSAFVLVVAVSAFACPGTVPSGVTTCYYIDYASGSDSANGTSESTPWQHAPGMANATGNVAGHTPGPGEGWIFKGGVTVDYHAFPMNVPWGGASGHPDYMGYDSSWYTGGSWARPIFNGGGSGGYDTSARSLITDVAHHSSYVVIDNLEFTGIYFGAACSSSGPEYCGAISQYGYSGSDVSWEIKNVYVHGWSHCSFSGACGDPGNESALMWAKQDTVNSSIHDSVIDGSDSSQDCCNALSAWTEYNNYIAYVDNAVFGEINLFHDNVITHMVPPSNGVHGNCIHLFGGDTINELVYNNYITCLNSGTADEMFLIEEDTGNVYAFNNVMVEDGHGTGFEASSFSGNSFGGAYYLFQNTQEGGSDSSPASSCVDLKAHTNVTVKNGFCVSSNSNQPTVAVNGSYTGTFTSSPNISKTCSGGAQTNWGGSQICAPIGSGNGTGNLNPAETYPFAPLDSAAAAMIGTAPGNSGLCATIASINAAAGTACLSDTTLGVAYDKTNHTVSFPARTPVQHSPTGAWQIGAYEFGEGLPNPPTGLAAVIE